MGGCGGRRVPYTPQNYHGIDEGTPQVTDKLPYSHTAIHFHEINDVPYMNQFVNTNAEKSSYSYVMPLQSNTFIAPAQNGIDDIDVNANNEQAMQMNRLKQQNK